MTSRISAAWSSRSRTRITGNETRRPRLGDRGRLVRWTFVQGDGQRKMRPAIILGAVPPFNDWLVCAVSSQVQRAVNDLDIIIDARHPDFHRTGLRMESVVRVAQLTTLPDKVVRGRRRGFARYAPRDQGPVAEVVGLGSYFPNTSRRCHFRYSGLGPAASAGMASGLPS